MSPSTRPNLRELARRQLEAANRRDLDTLGSHASANVYDTSPSGPVGSSAHIEARQAQVTEWTDGLVTQVTVYIDVDEARAAAERLAESRG